MRKRTSLILAAAVAASLAVAGVAQDKAPAGNAPPDTRAADEKAIRAETAAWAEAGVAKDAERFVTFYAPDASVFPPNAPLVTGKGNILAFWKEFFTSPGFAAGFTTTHIEVARSGDLAFETGTYTLTLNDAQGKPVTTDGKYVVVWKKQPDGKWKARADIFNSDR
ncbi:MAG TPA: SgcJ/EcaC family oxidoreductase [Terriglobales bacterium]|nr:SgcJ/EcaC family oxidoreductase [Terriglobales bacterium]